MGLFATLREALFGPPPLPEEERQYLRTIALDPDNESLYTGYAEWLKNRGDEWGDFVLVDQQLDGMAEDDPAREPLNTRWTELYDKHAERRCAAMRKLGLCDTMAKHMYPLIHLHRGVIREIWLDRPDILPEKPAEVFLALPGLQRIKFHGIRHVRGKSGPDGPNFANYEPDFEAILALPQMEQITDIEFSSLDCDDKAIRALAKSPALRNLRTLTIDRLTCDPALMKKFASLPQLSNLRVLDLVFTDIDDDILLAFLRNPQIKNLRALKVGGKKLTVKAIQAIATCPNLGNLQELEVPRIEFGPTGAQYLAKAPLLRKLTKLDLREAKIGEAGAMALAQSVNLANVKELELNENDIGPAGAQALFQSPHLTKVERFHLSENKIGSRGFAMISQATCKASLMNLAVSKNEIGDAAIQHFAAADFPRLRELDLSRNKLTAAGVSLLLKAKWIGRAKNLYLSDNPLGEAGAKLFAQATNLTALEYFSLSDIGELPEAVEKMLNDRFGDVVSL